ncbi:MULTISPECIES: ABC transporter permease [Mammaliicoccus]|uniref:ABC transporter permease n=1 Tax=Mammaliicoccus sciuri TaxID=1296 RepID=A0AAW5LPQ3_MAMSC|nr:MULTISPECIES: ABC transporter permease [Mammaliicoccus]MBG9210611.1 ABC transporter permease [Mammaliicoccus sciuri]MCD5141824.1 ABC transporter permease [Mammaliicoccus sciuri]MCI8455857.1 ABC transporter permease [Mammaliicoccus sciuri]MCQ9304424.1 ABC transporter permease [Mammaliicoccus sciuri]MDT0702361.1 ABC transporter permease [Mammaliicoccus sciuri]
MSTIKLFNIYHSFLIKKWYLIAYILLLFLAVLAVMIGVNQVNEKNQAFTIGIVDKDQSKETKLILNAIGDGQSLGNDLSIKHYNEEKARQLLSKKKIDGYFVFKDGMTKAFYKNGELPIVVNTYDKQSVESIIILQLTDSVYSRLMLSMGGAISYTSLYPSASENELLTMMTDMLFTGLNRSGSFDDEPIKVFDTFSYYTISTYFVSIFFFFFSIFSILKMNQKDALKERLSMYHFSYEKLTIVRGVFSLFYTTLWSILGLWVIIHFLKPEFEMYNIGQLSLDIAYYLIMIFLVFLFIDIAFRSMLNYLFKVLLTLVILLLSGAVIPIIYLKSLSAGLIEALPFSIVFNQLVEMLLNNYIIDTHPMYYWHLGIMLVLVISALYWRYRR